MRRRGTARRKQPGISLAWLDRPLVGRAQQKLVTMRPGERPPTIDRLVRRVRNKPPGFAARGVVRVGGQEVPRELWKHTRPKLGADGYASVTLHVPLADSGSGGRSKNPLATIAAIALIVVAATISGGALAPAFGPLFAAGQIGAVLTATAVTVAGSLAISALTPPPVSSGLAKGEDVLGRAPASLDGNVLQPQGPIPHVIGTHRIFPPLAAEPLIETVGDDEFVEAVYVLAGAHDLGDIKIGDTFAADMTEVQVESRSGLPGEPALSLVQRYSRTDGAQVRMSDHQVKKDNQDALEDQTAPENSAPDWHSFIAKQSPGEIWTSVAFPGGLIDANAVTRILVVPFRIRIRQQGDTDWINLPEIHIANRKGSPFKKTIKLMWDGAVPTALPTPVTDGGPVAAFTFAPGLVADANNEATDDWVAHAWFSTGSSINFYDATNAATTNVANTALYDDRVEFFLDEDQFPRGIYEVQIIRGMPFQSTNFARATYLYSSVSWDFFTFKHDGTEFEVVYSLDNVQHMVMVERFSSIWNERLVRRGGFAKIAVKAKNRRIERLSCLASGYVNDWNGTAWESLTTSSNPAPHFRQVLAGSLSVDPMPPELIDDDELLDWRTRCENRGYEVNLVIEGQSQAEVLDIIASCGFGRKRQSERWGVIQDRDRSDDSWVQKFTPLNMTGFRWEKIFLKRPDGLRVSFRDSSANYETREVIVPDEGIAEEQVSRPEEVTYLGLVTEAEVRRRAEFDLGQARERAKLYYLDTDLESLACQRGSLVAVQSDVLSRHAGYARVRTVQLTTDGVVGVTLDAKIPTPTGGFFDDEAPSGTDFFDDQAPSGTDFFEDARTGVAIRLKDGTEIVKEVEASDEETDELTFVTPFADPGVDADGDDLLGRECLLASGELGSEVKRLIVSHVLPQSELRASLVLVDEAPQLFVHEVDAVRFDGSNDLLTRGAELTGLADGQTGSVSLWFRKNGNDGANSVLLSGGAAARFRIRFTTGNKLQVRGENAAGAQILLLESTTTYTSADTDWHHLLASWDLANAAGRLYVDGVDVLDTATDVLTNDTIDYIVAANFAIGAEPGGSNKLHADLSEVWFDDGYLDFSDEDVRAKFVESGHPLDLDDDGSRPTDVAPLVYLSGPLTAWHTNKGTGGGFTVTGALTAAPSSPSD